VLCEILYYCILYIRGGVARFFMALRVGTSSGHPEINYEIKHENYLFSFL